jgi:hypothetical protein
MYLLLNVVDGISRLNLEGDGLAGECLDEDLHLCWCVFCFLQVIFKVVSGLFLETSGVDGNVV